MATEKTKVIRVSAKFYDKVNFLSKGQGISPTDFTEKLADALIQLCSTFNTNPFVLTYEFTLYPEKQLVIKAEGQSTFVIGSVPEKELEAERKLRFNEVALSIAEHNGKSVKIKEKSP